MITMDPAPEFTPILVLGDAPNLTTGLARIARDLVKGLFLDSELGILPIRVAQLGYGYDGSPYPWPVFPVMDVENWAHDDIERTWRWFAGDRPGILLTVWDPARCIGASSVDVPGLHRWGYFAIDGDNHYGRIGGPAAAALKAYDRILAYSRFGAGVIKNTLQRPSVDWLPHGISFDVFRPRGVEDLVQLAHGFHTWAGSKYQKTSCRIGCVTTNQSRKDLGTLFEAVELVRIALQRQETDVALWLHVDRIHTRDWSIPELAEVFHLNSDALWVTTPPVDDVELAVMYTQCDVTFAPGLGEGFGYPIAESLACGTPVVHVDYAAGAEIVPKQEWLSPGRLYRYEGPYVIRRPLLSSWNVHERMLKAALLSSELGVEAARDYCRGSVAHLDWKYLWPRWRSWVKRGLEELEELGVGKVGEVPKEEEEQDATT